MTLDTLGRALAGAFLFLLVCGVSFALSIAIEGSSIPTRNSLRRAVYLALIIALFSSVICAGASEGITFVGYLGWYLALAVSALAGTVGGVLFIGAQSSDSAD